MKHTVAVDDGDWHFVTGAYDGQASGTNLRIFIDGESGPSKDVREYDISDEPDTHIIGGNANWLGGIAHVIFHDGALTQTEHTDLYEAAL